jgi:hypothetical protein
MSNPARTALITGASAGIGEAFARLLAARGDKLILTARRVDRLQTLADELKKAYGTESVVIAVDLVKPDGAANLFAETEKRGLVVDLLINNAGFGKYGKFWEQPVSAYADMIQLNITALMTLSHLYLAGMRARKHGGIINVASVAGFPPMPNFSVYAASKAFVLSFSQALAIEAKADGVMVSVLCPGSTATEFQDVASGKADLTTAPVERNVQTAEDVARAGLDGYEAGKIIVVSGTFNKLSAAAIGFLPRSLVRRVAVNFTSKRDVVKQP